MKKFTTAVLLVAIIVIGAVFVIAQTSEGPMRANKKEFGKRGMHGPFGRRGMGRHRGQMMGRIFRQLDLTDEQKEKIQSIIKSSREDSKALRKQMRTNRKELHNLSENGNVGESKIKNLAKKQGNLHAKMIVQRHKSKAQIYAILTPEQQAKVTEIKANFKKKMKARKAKWSDKRKKKTAQ